MGMELPLDGTRIRKVNSLIPQIRWIKGGKKSMNPWNSAPESFQGWCMTDCQSTNEVGAYLGTMDGVGQKIILDGMHPAPRYTFH